MNIESLKPTSYLMVNGTSNSKSYVAFARKGNVLFSFRPNAVAPGSAVGVPNVVYVGVRLRLAFEPEVIKKELNIAVPNPAFDRPAEALPDMTWETDLDGHAATQVSIFLKGTFQTDAPALFQQFESGEVAAKLADYLISLVGDGDCILNAVEIATFIQETFEPAISALKSHMAVLEKMQEATSQTIGTVGVQAQILKKLYEQTNPYKADKLQKKIDHLHDKSAKKTGKTGLDDEHVDDIDEDGADDLDDES